MNILEALTLVDAGHKIRRPCWLPGDYIGKSNQGQICIMGCGTWGRLTMMTVENIQAQDWQIYEESK